MKRLLILTIVSVAAGTTGCKCCGLCGGGSASQVYRPTCPTSTCGSAPAYAGSTFVAPGTTAQPYMVPQTVPGGAYPGPEVYTPAN